MSTLKILYTGQVIKRQSNPYATKTWQQMRPSNLGHLFPKLTSMKTQEEKSADIPNLSEEDEEENLIVKSQLS